MKNSKTKTKPVIKKNYEISWHNPVVANTISEASEQAKVILAGLEKLAQWEKKGKIEVECGCDSPSFQIITVLDTAIKQELQKIGIVSCYEVEAEESEQSDDSSDAGD
jgi:hypothetical protein